MPVCRHFVATCLRARALVGVFLLVDACSANNLSSNVTFPHAGANGLDVTAGAVYDIRRTFELQMSASFRRYGFGRHSQPGDTFIAGGASDQYRSMALAIACRPSLERH